MMQYFAGWQCDCFEIDWTLLCRERDETMDYDTISVVMLMVQFCSLVIGVLASEGW